jgi:bidirectional [NiFe] hydrogenase diaphorase subunit
MVTLTIDGQIVHVERETPIIEVARQLGIHIPTLCYHQAIKAYGVCRLCVVEVRKNNWFKLVTSCNYPAEEGLEVFTSSDRVKKTRKMVLELLLARCPHVPVIRQLAEKMGIRTLRLKKKEDQTCILCGLCVRVCDEIAGVRAIGFVNRGAEREVSTPFHLPSDACIGCGACTYICPTGCIEMVYTHDGSSERHLSMGNLDLTTCNNNYECDTCEIDQQFIEDMKRIIRKVRKQKTGALQNCE